jgi:hypothetical protein
VDANGDCKFIQYYSVYFPIIVVCVCALWWWCAMCVILMIEVDVDVEWLMWYPTMYVKFSIAKDYPSELRVWFCCGW